MRKYALAAMLGLSCLYGALAQPTPYSFTPAEVQQAKHEAGDALREAERLRQEADRAEKDKKLARAQRDAARKAAQRAEALAKAAQQRLAEMEHKAKALAAAHEKALRDAAEAMKIQKRQTLWELGGAGAALALLALVGGLLLAGSRRRRREAESEMQFARREALDAVTPVAGTFDLLLEGGGGVAVALKIPAIALNPQSGGAIIGRSPQDAAFVINQPSISRRHCRLSAIDGVLRVEDLQSTNGITVNGQTVSGSATLCAGDMLALGDVHLKVRRL